MSLTVAYRLICADCGYSADLMKCFETRESVTGEEYDYDLELCQECVEKRDNNEEETQDAEECTGDDVLDCVVVGDDEIGV